VRDALALPVVRRAEPEVLAGEAGLGNEIRWVHVGEAVNMASLLKGGELLLSTGMGIGRTAAAQRGFVAELARLGIAALAIELGTAVVAMPAPLVAAAAAEGVCLLAFHREVRFVEITEAVHRELIDQGGELRRRGDDIHRRFTSLMLGGARVPDVLVELAHVVGNPVVLERAGHGVAYHASHGADDATVLGAWGSFTRGLAAAPDAVTERVPMGGDGSWGRLVVLAIDSPLDPQDRVAVERAVGLIALALMREHEDEALATRRLGDFLSGLTRSVAGAEEIAARAAELGFSPRGEALLPIALAPAPGAAVDPGAPAWMAVRRDLHDELGRQAVPVLVGSGEGDETLLVLGLAAAADRERIADRFAALVADSVGRRLDHPEPATICVGAACPGWLETGPALAAAADAVAASAQVEPRPWHDVAVASTDRLLFALRERPELHRFTELRLRALLEQDRVSRGDLVKTLAALCANGGRRKETALSLHIERQTLYHRLKRIEATVGDLGDGETLLSLHLALKANRYLQIS
jgi:PucR family transcriptional regulator, purine catabolism regulatory protein